MKNTITTIITIGVVLIAVLFVAKVLFVPEQLSDMKTIQAQGSAESISQPDQAEMYLRIEVLKDTADLAATESKAKSTAVVDAIKKFEGAVVETTNYNIYKKEDWTQDGPVFKGYVATYSLKVTTKNFDNVGKILDAAVNNGANGVDNVQFTLSKDAEEKVRSEVLKKAGEVARLKAEATAAGVGVKLGDIVSVSEGNFYAPPIYYARAMEAVSAGKATSDLAIEPSSITVTATINVAYKIK